MADIVNTKGNKGHPTASMDPPMTGHAVQYERLWLEEVALEKERAKILQSSSSEQQQCQSENYQFRSMIHRASLDGLLISAQCAASKVKSDPKFSGTTERGLDSGDAVNALSSLRDMKMRQLESDDNKIPFTMSSSSSARWKKNVPLDTNSIQAATADSFFAAFPECKRRLPDNEEESDDDDEKDDDVAIVQKPKSARKERKDKGTSPILVSSSSNSPSSNHRPDDEVQIITKQQQQQQQHIRNRGSSNQQQIHTQQNYNNVSIPNNNQTHRENNQKPQNRINNQLPQQHNKYHHNPYQNQAANKFDYNDTNSGYGEQQPSTTKANPFRTAKELGPKFDPKRLQNGRKDDNDWDNYENNNNTSGYSGGNRMGGRPAQSSSGPTGPQQMVRAAIRGPLSAGLKRKFQPPLKREGGPVQPNNSGRNQNSNNNNNTNNSTSSNSNGNNDEELPEELRGLDKELIEKINNEIVDDGQKVTFDDIAGLENAKNTVNELVIYPMKRPDLFTGLRACPKGLLLFGPPGTGKTLIGKAISYESGATFFSISSSSLTSKWIGEGEKLVKTLFAVASYRSPSVVFIDEVDSMLTQRKSDENEASRRIKTEFLVQLDGAGNDRKGHVLVIGATNLPQELDDAARRRFVKRLYIPLPDQPGRECLLRTLLVKNSHSLTDKEIIKLSRDTDGYSGADLKNLCTDASMGPMRSMTVEEMMSIKANEVPPIAYKHFRQSLRGSSPSVAQSDLQVYLDWNNTYGSKVSNDLDDEDDDYCSEDENE
ncbi:fidgetin-like protein [Skeletonema marinoi]|uniref:Fidgetin-like protein n=1 Tax=Skeletonema marinoi TaxID=267567 RepID=A0AAD8YB35_9STRA|nr:fidgetin-like protein [Skeletonema marinoi]